MNCNHCGNKTNNPKFCSKSCAAIYNNKLFPKRATTRLCTKCDNTVKSCRHSLCNDHWIEYQQKFSKEKTIGDYRNKLSVRGKHPSWLHSHIRLFAKSWNKDLLKLPCAHCGYSKHVELCHIKAISLFSDDTILEIVNNKDNLIQLCPNCHWEYDNTHK